MSVRNILKWLVLLLNRRDERRFLIFCYARRTLIGHGETKVVLREVLMKRHYFLKEQQGKNQVEGSSSVLGQKPIALGLKRMLNCIDQE